MTAPLLAAGQGSMLDELAAATQRSLAADSVVIALASERRPGEGSLDAVGIEGIDVRARVGLCRGLTVLDGALDFGDRPRLAIASLAETQIAGADVLLEHGFASLLAAPVQVDGERLGAIYAFNCEPSSFANEALIDTFARQAAIAVGHHSLRNSNVGSAGEQSLAALDKLIIASHDFSELSRAIEAAVTPVFQAEKTGIMVWDEPREVLQMVGGSFAACSEDALSCQVNVLDPVSNSARVFTTGQGYFCNEAREDPGIMQEYVRAFGIEKLLTTPLILAGRAIGVLHIANPATDFTVADLEQAASLTPRIAGGVELARTLFGLRRRSRLEEVLSSVAVAVASGDSVRDFLWPALKGVGEAVGASLLAMVPDGGEPAIWRNGRTPLVEVVLEEVARRPAMQARVVGPEKAGDPGSAVFYAPVHLGGQRVGTLAALRTWAAPFDREERRALVRLAGLAALSFATERYQQQRAELARLQERQRIADDLHDDVAQVLFAAQLNLDAILERKSPDDASTAGVERAHSLLARADATIRRVIHQLSNPSAPDFEQRLAGVVASVEAEFSVAIHMHFNSAAVVVANRLRRPPADALIKAAREALVNAAKHAGPSRIRVQLTVTGRDRLLLTVIDDGVGRVRGRTERGYGLSAVRRVLDAHGGCLRVGQAASGGTKLTASLPIPAGLDGAATVA